MTTDSKHQIRTLNPNFQTLKPSTSNPQPSTAKASHLKLHHVGSKLVPEPWTSTWDGRGAVLRRRPVDCLRCWSARCRAAVT
eukprot:2070362-Rhodomonas_salina.1